MKTKKLLGIDMDALIEQTVRDLFETVDPNATRDELEEKLKQEKMAKAVSKSKARSKKNPEENAGDEAEGVSPEKPTKIKHEKVPDINSKVIKDLDEFKKLSDLIVANRMSDELISVKNKVYTRDLFNNY